MIRILSALAGLVFAGVVLLAFVMGATTWLTEEPMHSADHEFHLDAHGPKGGYSFDGPVGKWDVAQLQRGLKVYSEVCAACHSLKFVAFRDLEEIGYSEAQVKAFAATKQVPGIDPNTGESPCVRANRPITSPRRSPMRWLPPRRTTTRSRPIFR